MPATIDQRLTTSEAARIAGVSEQSIRSWARAGILPHEQTPLGMLFALDDLGALITARERQRRGKVRSRQLGRESNDDAATGGSGEGTPAVSSPHTLHLGA